MTRPAGPWGSTSAEWAGSGMLGFSKGRGVAQGSLPPRRAFARLIEKTQLLRYAGTIAYDPAGIGSFGDFSFGRAFGAEESSTAPLRSCNPSARPGNTRNGGRPGSRALDDWVAGWRPWAVQSGPRPTAQPLTGRRTGATRTYRSGRGRARRPTRPSSGPPPPNFRGWGPGVAASRKKC